MFDFDSFNGKNIKVFTKDGEISNGKLIGYNYEYDDSGNLFIEFDLMDSTGFTIGFDSYETLKIELEEFT